MENTDANLYEDDIKLYSRKFIIIYGTICSVFLASFLTSSNLKNLGRNSTLVNFIGALYSLTLLIPGIYLGDVSNFSPYLRFYLLPLLLNFIYMMIQDQIVLEPITPEIFDKKSILKPLVIGMSIPIICTIASVFTFLSLIISNAGRM